MDRFFETDYSRYFLREALQDLDVSASSVGNEAIVENIIIPGVKWRVRYRATLWSARCVQTGVKLVPEDIVYVVGRYGLTLLIETEKSES